MWFYTRLESKYFSQVLVLLFFLKNFSSNYYLLLFLRFMSYVMA